MTVNTDEVLSILIHGSSKVGKSSVSFSAPLPLCVLDAEGSTKFINTPGFRGTTKLRKISWNPIKEKPPRYDGTWDVCVVKVTNWATMVAAYQHLQMSPHDFVSLSIDSITEIQRKCKANLKGTEQLQQQDWGALLTQMDNLIRGYRDLTLLDNTLRCVIFIAETKMHEGKWRPFMQGAIATSLPYWVDICGYAFLEPTLDANNQPTGKQQKLLVSAHPQYEAGERVQGRLPDIVVEPNIAAILETIYG